MMISKNPLPKPFLPRFTPRNGLSAALLARFTPKNGHSSPLLGRFTPKNGVSGALLHGFTPKFRLFASILSVALLATCLTACGGGARTDKEDQAVCDAARQYADSAGWLAVDRSGCRIRYPKDWTLQPENENAVFYLYAPAESDADRFRENVSLVVEVLPNGKYDADSYVKEAIKLLQGQVTTNERVVRAGHEGRRLVYTQRPALDVMTTNELYVWVINGKAYLLAFSRESGNEGNQANAGERILQTFEFR